MELSALSSSCQEMSDGSITKLDAQQQVDPGLRIQPRHMRKQLQNCRVPGYLSLN